jgi:hypothetical protein
MTDPSCHHFEHLSEVVDPTSHVCDECVAMGSTWVHLRSCLACGHVGCCDQSVNRHARKHWEQVSTHPLVQSIEPGESWRYCFEDHYLVR